MILAIDFDGVIHNKAQPIPGRRMGGPITNAPSAVTALFNAGHTIIVFTVMATNPSGKKCVEDWLKYYNVPFHEVTAIKPNADIFLDDRSLRFTGSWDDAMAAIGQLG